MKTTIMSSSALAILLAAALVPGCSKPRAVDALAAPMINTLLKKALAEEFTPGREVVIDYVEVPPNTTMDRHWHPGEEFHYYVEGQVELAIDGAPPIIGKPGMVAHVPYKAMHTVITREKGVKLLVFRVHMKGEPVRFLEKDAGAKK